MPIMRMRKIIVSIDLTLDGRVSGPHEELDWAFPGVDESQPDKDEFLRSVDTILLGRVTYEGLAGYWPDQSGEFADWMNKTPKIVFSNAPIKVAWGKWDHISLIHDHVTEEVKRLKQQAGRDMVIFGRVNLVQGFTNLGLVDEFRLGVHPVVLEGGNLLFDILEE